GTEDLQLEYEAPQRPALTRVLRWRVTMIAMVLGLRDFAGVASITLASVFLQKAHHYSVQQAGFALGIMMLMAVIINPVAVFISPGRRRLPMLSGVLVLGGLTVALTPHVPAWFIVPLLCIFQMFQLSSYAVSDAAMLERVVPDLRGRVVGLFLTL